MMSTQAATNIAEFKQIRADMYAGRLTYAEAEAKAAPIIKRINDTAAEVAKKYGRRPSKVGFSYLLRATD